MLDTAPTTGPPLTRRHGDRFLALGVALVLLAAVALFGPVVFRAAVGLVVGLIMITASICQVFLAFFAWRLRDCLLHLSSAALGAIVGFLVISHPDEAGEDLALLLAAFLVVGGLTRICVSLTLRVPARRWLLAAGGVALALAGCVWAQAPTRGVWLISLCLTVDFLCHGASWVWLSLALRGGTPPLLPDDALNT
jgi:uncharacterized membrane protein HdeD (DUF308 family)